MKPRFIGSRLYSEIVYPLLAASIAVGLVATAITFYFLQDLTDKWIRQTTRDTSQSLSFHYAEYARQMERVALHAAESPGIRQALMEKDASAISVRLNREYATLDYDGTALLDETGRVVAIQGLPGVGIGDRPLGDWGSDASPKSGIIEVNGGAMLVVPKQVQLPGRRPMTLAVFRRVDEAFLNSLGLRDDIAVALYTKDGELITSAFGETLQSGPRRALAQALASEDGRVRSFVVEAAAEKDDIGEEMQLGETTFEVWAEPIGSSPSQDRVDGYLMTLLDTHVTQQTGRTTLNVLLMWSVAAVVSLIGFGGWVARRVSDPLVQLSQSARRVADGDFATSVKVRGANEITELAETFNQMTESLRDRSDSLTKKVLELATLYDMSRALGSTLDLDELLDSVLESALRIFDLDLGYIALHDQDTGLTTIKCARGVEQRAASLSARSSMSEWVIREGRPLIFNPDAGKETQVDVVTGARAALCVPLAAADGVSGAITIGSSDAEYHFGSDDVRLLSTIANHVTIAVGNIELFTSLQEAYLATVRSLAAAVDAKDSYTRGHSDRVAMYATMIADRMSLSHEQRIALEMAAYLHDIGKIGVPEEILLKPGMLDEREMAQMRHHPLIGANILKPVTFPWAITPVVRHHHESFDGTGYPAGLRGEEIPLLARILTVADSFEAMTADRPYRQGRSPEEAIEELISCSGSQFDPRIVSVFVNALHESETTTEAVRGDTADEVMFEESRAIFAALLDGVFTSFRRLGGPRLASNIESELDAYFVSDELPFRITRGHLTFLDTVPEDSERELERMRDALRKADSLIARVSGATLVEHFYADALGSFSSRMKLLARELDFHDWG